MRITEALDFYAQEARGLSPIHEELIFMQISLRTLRLVAHRRLELFKYHQVLEKNALGMLKLSSMVDKAAIKAKKVAEMCSKLVKYPNLKSKVVTRTTQELTKHHVILSGKFHYVNL